jgi:hypothetical protein
LFACNGRFWRRRQRYERDKENKEKGYEMRTGRTNERNGKGIRGKIREGDKETKGITERKK